MKERSNEKKGQSLPLDFLAMRFDLLFVAILSLLCTWQLWEQDIFWQIRAGDEILSGLGLQTKDTWSFTAAGRPWINFQWLATVMIRIFYGFGQEGGLVVWRAAGAFILFYSMAAILRLSRAEKRLGPVIVVLVWVYLCIAFKIELRSDLFNFIIFAVILWLWQSSMDSRRKRWVTLLCCLVAVNLHAGTAPFILLLSGMLLASNRHLSIRKRLIWCVFILMTMLANPYGYRVLSPISDIFFYSKTNLFDNYDHYPLMFGPASLGQFGIAAWAWTAYAIFVSIVLLGEAKSVGKDARWTWILTFMAGCIFTALAINRMRAIPYHVLFFLPQAGRGVEKVLSLPLAQRARLLIGIAVATLLLGSFYLQEKYYPLERGLSLAPAAWPIGSTRFINTAKPKGNILHTWGYGGYFVWHLRDYPTFGDPREAMFWDLQPKMLAAQGSRDAMRSLCEAYDINVAVIPTPSPQYNQEIGTFVDGFEVIFPQSEWALVYFDDISTVFVKRIPEHRAIIQNNEFVYLKPQYPGSFHLRSPSRTPDSGAVFEKELQRCRTNEPLNVICRIAQAVVSQRQGVNGLREAQALLEEVMDRPTTQKFELLAELQSVYGKLGLKDKVAATEQSIKYLLGSGGS